MTDCKCEGTYIFQILAYHKGAVLSIAGAPIGLEIFKRHVDAQHAQDALVLL